MKVLLGILSGMRVAVMQSSGIKSLINSESVKQLPLTWVEL
jgi:hypothetical protein